MEQQKQTTVKRNGMNVKGLIVFIPLIIALLSYFGVTGGNTARKEAENHVKQSVYASLGVVPQKFNSEVIYKDGTKRLIEVKYGLTSTEWDGTYCVYLNDKYVVNSTVMMGAGYSFKEHIGEVKALFGL